VQALIKKRVFDSEFEHHVFDDGVTIYEILEQADIPKEIYPYLKVTVNDYEVFAKYWAYTRPNKNTLVKIHVVPAGGDFGGFFKTAVIIAVTAAVSAYAGPGVGGALLTAAASIGTSLALNAIFPPPVPSYGSGATGANDTKRIDVVTGQSNVVDRYGPCVKAYGRNRIYPRVAAQPYGFLIGDDSYLVTIYDLGIGDVNIEESSIRIGDTFIGYFNNVDYSIVRPHQGDIFNFYTNSVNVQNLAVEYNDVNDSAVRSTSELTDFFQVDLVFPQGLAGIDSGGNYVNNSVDIGVEFREVGSSQWKKYNDVKFDLDSRYSSRSYNSEIVSITSLDDGPYYGSEVFLKDFEGSKVFWDIVVIQSNSGNEDSGSLRVDAWYNYHYKISRLSVQLNIGDTVVFRNQVYKITQFDNGYSYLDRPIEVQGTKLVENVPHNNRDDYHGLMLAYNPFDNEVIELRRFFNTDINIVNNTLNRFIASLTIYPESGQKQYEVRITKTSETKNGMTNNNYNSFTWGSLKSYSNTAPIKTKVPHTFLELKIKASEQLNGQVDNLSVEGISLLDVYNEDLQQWEKRETSNPAWVFVDILTGELNQRKINKNQLHLASILKWAEFCESNTVEKFGLSSGFECNFVLDYKTTVRELVQQVCSSGRAALNIFGGSYGVILDEAKEFPTQIWTTRNITSFKSSRSYTDKPHAVKCRYIEPMANWQVDEVIAYADGYDQSTAELFEEIDVFACTNMVQAWRQGRYYLAQAELRQETIEIKVGIDSLSCTRGDLVRLAMDTMKAGGSPFRVRKIQGNFITLDDDIVDIAAQNKQIEARHRSNGRVIIHNVLDVVDINTVEVENASYFSIDDLVLFGEAGKTAMDLIVKSIDTDTDLNAVVLLQEYAPEIFNADKGPIPDYRPVINTNDAIIGKAPGAVQNIYSTYAVSCATSENAYRYGINLSWTPPASLVSSYEVYVTINSQTNLAGIVKSTSFTYFADSENLGVEHKFIIVSVSGTGEKLDLNSSSSYAYTPTQDEIPPANVKNLSANILTERLELTWDDVEDCDLDRYIIKYYPGTSGARWSISDKIADVPAATTSKSVPLRNGTYLIKAVDWAGNMSTKETRVITTIPESTDVYLEKEYRVPLFDGKKINLQSYKDRLILSSNSDFSQFNYQEGYYYFAEDIELGDVFKVRFEANVIAGGFTYMSLIKNWTKLADVKSLAGANFEGSVSADVEIRVKEDKDTLKDWAKLADVQFLAYGSEKNSGPWKKLTVGDYTGQKFQLRIKLSSKDNTLSPMLYSAVVKAYFPTRNINGNNALSGERVNFAPGFKELKSFNITIQENLAQGDYYEIIEKDKDGFKVQFFDSSGLPKNNITFDWIAVGIGVRYTKDELIYK